MSGSWPSPRPCATAPACRTSASRFPERFYDVGIAESAAVDIAAGLAKTGMRPVVCIYSTFLQRSFDQIFQEVALQNLPVVFCVDRAGMVGADGATHHGLMDIGYLRMLPNMVLTAPADAVEMRQALEFALAHTQPVVIRYPKDFVPPGASSRRRALRASPSSWARASWSAGDIEVLPGHRLLWDRADGGPGGRRDPQFRRHRGRRDQRAGSPPRSTRDC